MSRLYALWKRSKYKVLREAKLSRQPSTLNKICREFEPLKYYSSRTEGGINRWFGLGKVEFRATLQQTWNSTHLYGYKRLTTIDQWLKYSIAFLILDVENSVISHQLSCYTRTWHTHVTILSIESHVTRARDYTGPQKYDVSYQCLYQWLYITL